MLSVLKCFDIMLYVLAINTLSWKSTVPVMIFGMVGIFLVIGVIVVATYAINKLFSKDKNKKNDND